MQPDPVKSRGARGRKGRRNRAVALATAGTLAVAIGFVPLVFGAHGRANTTPPSPDTEGQSLPPEPAAIPVHFPLGSWPARRHIPGGIEGYANRVSVLPGDRLTLYVRTRARNYAASVYRMGYYSGTGARLMASRPGLAGMLQPPCALEQRGTVECLWRSSFILDVPQAWPSGVYLIKLKATDGSESFVPFVVRESTPKAEILFQVSVTTWQAYNAYGGRDLYSGPCPLRQPAPTISRRVVGSPSSSPKPAPSKPSPSPSPSPSVVKVAFVRPRNPQIVTEGTRCGFANRARAVSFDRPYGWPGTAQFFRFEYPMLYWLESKGYQVAYATDIDLHEGLDFLAARRVFIGAGHDEYYSLQMRRALEGALAGGTSLVFMGANDIYRHIRFEPSPLGPDRVIVNYKIAAEDPLTVTDPSESTGQWRDWPTSDPEQQLLGAQYECNPVRAPWVPTGRPAWLFRGTGLVAGKGIPNLVGYEYDRTFGREIHPADVVDVARSPLVCQGRPSRSDSTFYIAPSGAAVFDAGTLDLVCALGPSPYACHGMPRDARIQRLVGNLIDAMRARRFG